jgi:hypothetical protein
MKRRILTNGFLPLSALLVWVVCAADPGVSQTTSSQPAVCVEHLPGINYAFHSINDPRPVRVHVLIVDLSEPGIEPVVVLAESSPQEDRDVIRVDPRRLARHPYLLAFVNANPWTPWAPSYPIHVNITGLAATGGVVYTPHQGVSVWMDNRRLFFVGTPDEDAQIQEGVGGFQQILQAGKVIVQGGGLHPRTAIGVNEVGDRLYVVVADGRQEGFSEGMTLEELARLMRELGCRDAANMDGGGSSVLGITGKDGNIQILNHPPGPPGYLRPLPIILTFRQRPVEDKAADAD